MDFYTGRLLRIDLTRGSAAVEPLRLDWAELYVGGKGLLLRYLHEELTPGTDALAPAAPLMLFTGPFAGTAAPTCSRLVVGCLSPATGTYVDSYVGGSFAPELKFAGYDAVIVEGRSARPALVVIEDDVVEVRPAGHYWGMTTSAIEAAIRRDVGPAAKALSIGPAGENLVPTACLSTDQYHKAGRGGAGAVMGSKNLKAIVVRGTGAVTVGDAHAFAAAMERLQHDHLFTEDNLWATEEGTPVLVDAISGAGALPTRNWSTGTFAGAGNIDSQALLARKVKNRACFQCGLACRQFHEFAMLSCEGPEYETLVLCGANCGVDDLDALAAFNHACDEYGIDTISTGSVVALAMDLSERGIADYDLRFGQLEPYLALPGLIARREGIGLDLATGARALAARWGHPELASEVKGLELPAYDPRGAFGMALAYATSDRGGCHMRAFPVGDEILAASVRPDTLDGKAELVRRQQDFSALTFTGIWCANWALTTEQVAAQMRFLWRRDVSAEELDDLGARVWNLGRLLNLRLGGAERVDTLPERLLSESHPDGAAAGRVIGARALAAAVQEYYRARGWDEQGRPHEATLTRLGVDVRL
jgi:aldehyde:ferredoxin oxidoreductase